MGARQRDAANYMLLNVAVSAAIPHEIKWFVDQERPDRRVHGLRHGIPKSGKAKDAFPSGHAVHVGALAAAVSQFFPRWKSLIWTAGRGLAATRVVLLAHWTTDVLA